MDVQVTIALSVVPQKKHVEEMRCAACSLTDDESSVRVVCPAETPKKIAARFSIPKAWQIDVVDRIGKRFRYVKDYQTCSIWFSQPGGRRRRTRRR